MQNDINSIPQPILGEWYLDEFVGKGRYGEVYKAHNASRNLAAVKVIKLPNADIENECRSLFGDDEEALSNYIFDLVQEFGDEVESMKRIGSNCPNVVQMYSHVAKQDSDGIGWSIIIVMEFCTVLKKYISEKGLRVYDALRVGADVARALAACHENRIIHRDIKEDNLFVSSDGKYKIGDFGVAKVTTMTQGEKTQVGSPYYMAPEVYRSDYDHTVDIYSLGIVLYRLFNYDRIPFAPTIHEKERITRKELDDAHKRRIGGEAIPAPVFADERIAKVILRATQFNPEFRYKSAREMLKDIEGLLDTMSQQELSAEVPYPSRGRNPKWHVDFNKQTVNPSKTDEDRTIPFTGGGGYGEDPIVPPPETEPGNVTTVDGNSTVYVLSAIMKKLGRGTEVDMLIDKLNQKSDRIKEVERKVITVERKGKKKNKVIGIVAGVAIVALGCAGFIALNSTSYGITDRQYCYISSKTLLGGEEVFAEIPVSYLAYDKDNLYYSKKFEENDPREHNMYRMDIKTKQETAMCYDDCEHNILIGDYIYFTSYKEGEILCRIKKDASADNGDVKEVLVDYRCTDLRKDGNTLVYKMPDMGDKEYRLNTKTINTGENM